jgi:outer membrane protein assembly factor BamA
MSETITYWERQRQIAVDVLLPILSFRTSHYLTLGYRDRHLGALTTIPLGFTKPGEGVSRAIRVGWIYSSTKNYGFSISLEEGRLISLAFEREDQRLQSDFDVSKYIADWHEYVNLPIPHQVLALRLAGTFATGDLLAQRAFQLGGQSNVLGMPIVTIDQDDLLIRGFPVREFRGQRAALASIEYRFPIANIEQGPGTLPIFLERIHGGIFLDTGQAWDKSFSIANIKTGIGGELKADTTWSYVIPLRFRLGLARGFTGEGVTQVYLALGNAF